MSGDDEMFLNEREQESLFVARTLVLLSSTLGHDDIDNNSNDNNKFLSQKFANTCSTKTLRDSVDFLQSQPPCDIAMQFIISILLLCGIL